MENIKNIKEYIKTNKCERFFFEGLKEKTLEQKYQYLKNHFQYDIMNSWNNLKSIANNVKIYNLGLTSEQQNNFFEINEADDNFLYYETIEIIKEFEKLTNTQVYFNGRSGGYMVIVPDFETTKRNEHIFEWLGVADIQYFNTYKEFKQEQNKYNGGCYYQSLPTNYSRKEEIEHAYYYIKAFDKLCDILRSELIYILDNFKIEEHEETYTKTIKEIIL